MVNENSENAKNIHSGKSPVRHAHADEATSATLASLSDARWITFFGVNPNSMRMRARLRSSTVRSKGLLAAPPWLNDFAVPSPRTNSTMSLARRSVASCAAGARRVAVRFTCASAAHDTATPARAPAAASGFMTSRKHTMAARFTYPLMTASTIFMP